MAKKVTINAIIARFISSVLIVYRTNYFKMIYCSRNLPILFTVSVSILLNIVLFFAFSQIPDLEPPATKWHKISTP